MGLNPDYLLKSFSHYILLFVFLINHDILGNSFVAFEFSEKPRHCGAIREGADNLE
jgi:hypothetical protein